MALAWVELVIPRTAIWCRRMGEGSGRSGGQRVPAGPPTAESSGSRGGWCDSKRPTVESRDTSECSKTSPSGGTPRTCCASPRRGSVRRHVQAAAPGHRRRILDEEGRFSFISPSAEALLGYDIDAWIGRHVFDLIHPDDLAHVAESMIATHAVAGARGVQEIRVRHADGTWREVEALSRNLLDDPVVRGVVVSIRDTTERRRARENLRDAENRFARCSSTRRWAWARSRPTAVTRGPTRPCARCWATR